MGLRHLLLALIGSLAIACELSEADEDRTPQPTSPADSTATSVSTPSPTRVALGPAEHIGENTLAHISQLSEVIGSRVSGTAGEDAATDYISSEFESYGYDVELFEFDITGFRPIDVAIDDGAQPLQAIGLIGSPLLTVSGPAVFVGLADAAGISGRDLSGAVAVSLRGDLRFSEKYENVSEAGAVALLVVNNLPGLFSGSTGGPATIPVAGIAKEDRARLEAAADAGLEIHVSPSGSTRSVNVVARATPGAACTVVVGGHHDTVPGTPGATDNASGTSHTLELARAFASDGLDYGLCFVTFGGEESGLFGSAALVDEWRNTGELPEFMVNLDVTATGSTVELIGDSQLQETARGFADSLGVRSSATSLPFGTGSDHQSFQSVGVQVIFLSTNDTSNIHTPRDTADRVNTELVEGLGDVAYLLIQELLTRVAQPEDGS